MADLNDGESVEMKGPGARPLCPEERRRRLLLAPARRDETSRSPSRRRTCNHLRRLRSDTPLKRASVRAGFPPRPEADGEEGEGDEKAGPPLLLAERWDNAQDLAGWWLSEKLDGVRAYWDGKSLISRLGNRFHAPDWFLEGLPPDIPLDGELWIGRKAFQRTVGIVRRQDRTELWKEVRYVAFDAPGLDDAFEGRLAAIGAHVDRYKPLYLTSHEHAACASRSTSSAMITPCVEALGGEGLMLRQPRSRYQVGRSATLLKVKSFNDAEARVLETPRRGRHRLKGRLGRCSMEHGRRDAILGGDRLLPRRTRSRPRRSAPSSHSVTRSFPMAARPRFPP